jgi:hypothetical protein
MQLSLKRRVVCLGRGPCPSGWMWLCCLTFGVACDARGDGFGVPFSPPQPLNTNAIGDVGVDAWPHVAADGLGHWVAVWHANNDLGRTIGTDYDIIKL